MERTTDVSTETGNVYGVRRRFDGAKLSRCANGLTSLRQISSFAPFDVDFLSKRRHISRRINYLNRCGAVSDEACILLYKIRSTSYTILCALYVVLILIHSRHVKRSDGNES